MIACIDNYKKAELGELFKKYAIISPLGNELSEPIDFNMVLCTFLPHP